MQANPPEPQETQIAEQVAPERTDEPGDCRLALLVRVAAAREPVSRHRVPRQRREKQQDDVQRRNREGGSRHGKREDERRNGERRHGWRSGPPLRGGSLRPSLIVREGRG